MINFIIIIFGQNPHYDFWEQKGLEIRFYTIFLLFRQWYSISRQKRIKILEYVPKNNLHNVSLNQKPADFKRYFKNQFFIFSCLCYSQVGLMYTIFDFKLRLTNFDFNNLYCTYDMRLKLRLTVSLRRSRWTTTKFFRCIFRSSWAIINNNYYYY